MNDFWKKGEREKDIHKPDLVRTPSRTNYYATSSGGKKC